MKHLHPLEAFEFMLENPRSVLVDVRSELEYLLVGHPKGAVHLPWNIGEGWETNPDFVAQARKIAAQSDPFLIICRVGGRSTEAALLLEQAGFEEVYDILYGFEGDLNGEGRRSSINGWRHAGLPWEQL